MRGHRRRWPGYLVEVTVNCRNYAVSSRRQGGIFSVKDFSHKVNYYGAARESALRHSVEMTWSLILSFRANKVNCGTAAREGSLGCVRNLTGFRLLAPQFLKAVIAAAAVTVVFIANGVFLIIILVIILRCVEGFCCADGGGDIALERFVI